MVLHQKGEDHYLVEEEEQRRKRKEDVKEKVQRKSVEKSTVKMLQTYVYEYI